MDGRQVASGVEPTTSMDGRQVASGVEPGTSMDGQQVAMGASDEPTRELTPTLTEPLVESTQADRKVTPDKITPPDAGMEQGNVQIAMIQTPTPQQTPTTMSTSAPSQGLAQFSPMNRENLFLLHAARELNIA
jgi:hypothetical protein